MNAPPGSSPPQPVRPWELIIACVWGKGPGNEAGNAHQHILGCHLRTCCFPLKVTLEKQLPLQLCLEQEQLCACKIRLCCLVMNLPPNLSALRSKLEWKIICWHSPQGYHLPDAIAKTSAHCQILPSALACPSCCHPGDGDHNGFPSDMSGKSRWSAPFPPFYQGKSWAKPRGQEPAERQHTALHRAMLPACGSATALLGNLG